MRNIGIIFRRELASYFTTPLAYIFIIIFLLLLGTLTFKVGMFFEYETAELNTTFFRFHPWLFMLLIPAISMRLWSEERKSGSIELLLTLPISMFEAVLGKFLAAWSVLAIILVLTFPVWITVNFLGNPDNGTIVTGYIGSLLTAGAMLAIGSCISALTKNQVIAFIIGSLICGLFICSGTPLVLEYMPDAFIGLLAFCSIGLLVWGIITRKNLLIIIGAIALASMAALGIVSFLGLFPELLNSFLVEAIASMSLLTHFQMISKGVLDLREIIYFGSMILFWLYASSIVIELKKAS